MKDLSGERYGRFTVLRFSHKDKWGTDYFLCHCDCGKDVAVHSRSLTKGRSKSCGCLRNELLSLKSRKDLRGKKFGRLSVLRPRFDLPKKHNNFLWECKCECGKIGVYITSRLIGGQVKSCGCYQRDVCRKKMRAMRAPSRKDLTGKKFGRLLVLKEVRNLNNSTRPMWECRCECGKIHHTIQTNLMNGRVQSCGCYNRDVQRKKMQIHRQTRDFEGFRLMRYQQQRLGL